VRPHQDVHRINLQHSDPLEGPKKVPPGRPDGQSIAKTLRPENRSSRLFNRD
jgi:hypothetical protein